VGRLVVRGVKKAFASTVALAGVDLTVARGEVHAVLGENGAGKSTLMNILAGIVRPDAGTLTLDGERYAPADPRAARRAGIAMVHQELSLCPHLTVAENVLLGEEPTRFGVLRLAAMREEVERALDRVAGGGTRLSPDAIVADLSPAERQLVEIARALRSDGTRVLVLDEPTSSLSKSDAEGLFTLVRSLRERGLAIVYISHFLEEVISVADRYTVLRDGQTVGEGAIADTSPASLVALMAGRTVDAAYPRSESATEEAALSVNTPGISFELRKGEVLGIAGLVGSGRTELLRFIFGLDAVKRGEIRVGAFTGFAPPWERLTQGVGMLSEDRKGEALMLERSIVDNVVLSNMAPFVSPGAQRAAAERFIERLGIRCGGPLQSVGELSGGNQQKVALARLLLRDVDVLLLDEPTRGIDVGAKAQIYELLSSLTAKNKAILLVSSYLPELLGLCHRIAVMQRGRLGPARPAAEWTEHALLLEASSGGAAPARDG
jgi:ribose transport system ATP-binding protein